MNRSKIDLHIPDLRFLSQTAVDVKSSARVCVHVYVGGFCEQRHNNNIILENKEDINKS